MSGQSLDKLELNTLSEKDVAQRLAQLFEPYGPYLQRLELTGGTVTKLPKSFFNQFNKLQLLSFKEMLLLEEIPESISALMYLRWECVL